MYSIIFGSWHNPDDWSWTQHPFIQLSIHSPAQHIVLFSEHLLGPTHCSLCLSHRNNAFWDLHSAERDRSWKEKWTDNNGKSSKYRHIPCRQLNRAVCGRHRRTMGCVLVGGSEGSLRVTWEWRGQPPGLNFCLATCGHEHLTYGQFKWRWPSVQNPYQISETTWQEKM